MSEFIDEHSKAIELRNSRPTPPQLAAGREAASRPLADPLRQIIDFRTYRYDKKHYSYPTRHDAIAVSSGGLPSPGLSRAGRCVRAGVRLRSVGGGDERGRQSAAAQAGSISEVDPPTSAVISLDITAVQAGSDHD
ncbi:hypothetical protein [Catellatospora sichuanensis]|uniref:hypothetical protein n=1 Tax=Catellatospora sichuanensis TaxID=1969805 RepID=UPI001183D949|nr:hypothetical protein [Catellatospora sichuanensis]